MIRMAQPGPGGLRPAAGPGGLTSARSVTAPARPAAPHPPPRSPSDSRTSRRTGERPDADAPGNYKITIKAAHIPGNDHSKLRGGLRRSAHPSTVDAEAIGLRKAIVSSSGRSLRDSLTSGAVQGCRLLL